MQLAAGFHCARVREPAEQGASKLKLQLLAYLWKARFLPLAIGVGENGDAFIFAGGAHAARMGAKGHPGLLAALGRGAMANASKKLGASAASYAEAEAASTGERLPKRAWLRCFRAEQGGSGKEDVLLQGSKSAAALQSRYPCSAGKGSQRTHARRCFAAGKLESKELKATCLLSAGMLLWE